MGDFPACNVSLLECSQIGSSPQGSGWKFFNIIIETIIYFNINPEPECFGHFVGGFPYFSPPFLLWPFPAGTGREKKLPRYLIRKGSGILVNFKFTLNPTGSRSSPLRRWDYFSWNQNTSTAFRRWWRTPKGHLRIMTVDPTPAKMDPKIWSPPDCSHVFLFHLFLQFRKCQQLHKNGNEQQQKQHAQCFFLQTTPLYPTFPFFSVPKDSDLVEDEQG